MTDLFGNAPYVTIWDIIRHWAGRPMLTKLLQEYDKPALKAAALKTLEDEAIEQLPYLIAILKDEADGVIPVWKQSNEALYILAQDRGINTAGQSRDELINKLR